MRPRTRCDWERCSWRSRRWHFSRSISWWPRDFFAARIGPRRRATLPLPPCSILKPLRGLEPGAYDNLASFCKQDYPEYEILFAVGDAADPIVPVVERVIADFPEKTIRLVVTGEPAGANNKVSNLCRLAREAQIRSVCHQRRRCARRAGIPARCGGDVSRSEGWRGHGVVPGNGRGPVGRADGKRGRFRRVLRGGAGGARTGRAALHDGLDDGRSAGARCGDRRL